MEKEEAAMDAVMVPCMVALVSTTLLSVSASAGAVTALATSIKRSHPRLAAKALTLAAEIERAASIMNSALVTATTADARDICQPRNNISHATADLDPTQITIGIR